MPDPVVLVAHENETLLREIEVALAGAGVRVLTVSDGAAAESLLVQAHPAVLVVDVGISGRASFELCDRVTELGLRTRVLLVASVYNHTRYKRRPTSLHGADDYVEQHHIHDMLRPKVERLLGREVAVPTRGAVDPAAARRVQRAGDEMLTIRFDSLEVGRKRARALCELLVADMVLYGADELDAVLSGAPPSPRLITDLDEARRIFRERVPEPIRGERDWVGEAFEALVASRRRPDRRVETTGAEGASSDEAVSARDSRDGHP